MYFAQRHGQLAIEVEGSDAANFLNDLLTAQIATLPVLTAQGACLLSPQGRILFDMLVFRASETRFWLQLPAVEAGDFRKKLMMYRLRRDIQLTLLPDWQSGVIFGDASAASTDLGADLGETIKGGFADPRAPQLGWHLVSTAGGITPPKGAKMAVEADWQAIRIQCNVPEGPVDLERGRALMLEAGLNNLGALDFEKGCYIGQEVTARTHYRGLVKRRILPVRCAAGTLSPTMAVSHNDVVIGQILSCDEAGGAALANLRLDAVRAHMQKAEALLADGTQLSVHYPADQPPLIFGK